MLLRIAFATGLATLAGCASPHIAWQSSGGSRADGVVRMSYAAAELARPTGLDDDAARSEAQSRCAAWGYTDAEPFGADTRTCTAYGGLSGCSHYQVTREYQCLGQPEARGQ